MKDANVITHVPGRRSGDPTPSTTDRGPACGDVLGKCLLIDLIGRGATCTVFRALHQGLNLPVAVKVLPLDAGEVHRRAYEELKFEARLLAQLPHPHIVRVYDFEDDPAQPYLVLECVEGPSLADLILQSGRLALDRACAIIGEVGEALGALWKLGAVHRDVKPGNILLAKDGLAKLADFGQAVLVEEQEIAGFEGTPPLSDDVCGTAAYLAPEQFLAPSSVDHRSDIYALGATFYQAVTGQLPYAGRSRMEVLLKRVCETPTPPHELVSGLSTDVSNIILTMMAREPDDRYQSVEELRDALASLMGSGLTARVQPIHEPESLPQREDGAGAEASIVEEVAEMPAEFEEKSVGMPEASEPEIDEGEESEAPAEERPARRTFWKSLLSSQAEERPLSNEEWLRFVKRTLVASVSRKSDE